MGRVYKPSNVYIALVILRTCFALYGTGFIHPDEYFQNGEVTAGPTLGVHSHLTWEWLPVFPCRSIVPVWLTTGVPFILLKTLLPDRDLAPRVIFTAERLSFLGSSFLLDFATYHLVHDSARMPALLLLGSSYVLHTFQVRAFSNSIEAVLVASSLWMLKALLVGESLKSYSVHPALILSAISSVAVLGLFTRITFGAFFLPQALEVLRWSLRESPNSFRTLLRLISPAIVAALATGVCIAYADTAYFQNQLRPSHLEFTPLNFLQYNMLPSNLAQHGLHPRWLHILVNLPMIATPALLAYTFVAEWDLYSPRIREKTLEDDKRKLGAVERIQTVLNRLRWSAVLLLSIQPHQEPRFLTPLIAPMIAFVVNNGRILRAGRFFWVVWIVANITLAVLFGVLHQGGVVPSLFRVHDIIYDPVNGLPKQNFHVVYWKTYMPPRHLLAVSIKDVIHNTVTVSDFSGASSPRVLRGLQLHPIDTTPLGTILVAPFHAVRLLGEANSRCVVERSRVYPHLSLDHIGETMEVGWKDGFSLGIFDIDRDCLTPQNIASTPAR
ncbi:Alg9-like mannosyltransferase family-domain-containing protein [Epithele typhae]|uniref:Alg9-like mannosyltransferase family-domain-containing protein n=1 Tax=Epithele typhae TaxID=378194 RepID=UPI002008C493|nr:Alg9-like mannosyltransferase family-domain-containing protein [Epithele typhae]KAH9925027.1 Alg9-like mannosyltransferase family-domain-containing protein [Epithele typhae]